MESRITRLSFPALKYYIIYVVAWYCVIVISCYVHSCPKLDGLKQYCTRTEKRKSEFPADADFSGVKRDEMSHTMYTSYDSEPSLSKNLEVFILKTSPLKI